MSAKSVLSEEQGRVVEEDGYFVIEGVITSEECKVYIQRLDDYAYGRRSVSEAMMLERKPRVVRGDLAEVLGQDIRKIGEVARIDYLFWQLVLNSTIVAVMQELMKPAGVGSAKGIH